ncbi:hypothetical protein BCV70DRAFT_224717 [Testicularia cyperi]|uniref:Trypsin-like serine protease n=1 Tax=Testicularia cyperi TaxID=1882483 RepID=A0A317XYI6_9BASI|nr:hypothetical protein BCV70DRAFT_224717 [Testicularia cyperi]
MYSRGVRLRIGGTASRGPTSQILLSQRRALAVPVNPSSSVDALLGTSVPPPPREGEEYGSMPDRQSGSSTYRRNNPNDLSDLLRPSSASSPGGKGRSSSRTGERGSHAEVQRIKGTAIGAERKGIPIPSRDEMLEEMFKRPFREIEESKHIVDREHPHPIDALHGRNELDERILAAARALHAAATNPRPGSSAAADTYRAATIDGLLQRFEQRANFQLSIELPYEPTPTADRRVPLTSAASSEEELESAKDDGVLLLAYVSHLGAGRGQERISVCSGFAVQGGEQIAADDGDGRGPLIITCAHTLRASGPSKQPTTEKSGSNSSGSQSASDTIALAITRTGAIWPVRNLISSLPTSDIVLLQLGEQSLSLNGSGSEQRPIRTLPVSPYPAHVNSELSVSSFWGWEDDSGAILPAYSFDPDRQALVVCDAPAPPAGREREAVKLERDDAGRSRWGRARLVEYKDPCGAAAMVGTYDELAQLDYKLLVSSPANPPALQGDYGLRMSSTVSASQQSSILGAASASASASAATSTGSAGTNSTQLQTKTRQPLPNFPPPGSSGGPVVDIETGSVVGIVRGHKMSPLEGRRGDAIPAEKVFEFFALPGLGRKN